MKTTIKTRKEIILIYSQNPYLERAKLLIGAYNPSDKTGLARMVKTIRIAKKLGKELNPESLVNRYHR